MPFISDRVPASEPKGLERAFSTWIWVSVAEESIFRTGINIQVAPFLFLSTGGTGFVWPKTVKVGSET